MYVYIAVDVSGGTVLYAGEDLGEAQNSIKDDVEDNYNLEIEVSEEGGVEIRLHKQYKIMEVKVL